MIPSSRWAYKCLTLSLMRAVCSCSELWSASHTSRGGLSMQLFCFSSGTVKICSIEVASKFRWIIGMVHRAEPFSRWCCHGDLLLCEIAVPGWFPPFRISAGPLFRLTVAF